MSKNLTELVFILDKSGSMAGLESDTIGGFNSMLNKQKAEAGEAGEAVVTTVLFDNHYELLHDRINIHGVRPITEKEYFVGGSTALLDAIGNTINKIGNAQKYTDEALRANKVMFVIITDGQENASREYSYDRIRGMVERQKEKYGWEFIFMGANIDAIGTAQRFGIHADRAVDFVSDKRGTEVNYHAISEVVSEFRINNAVRPDWKAQIDEDYKRRGKKD